MFYRRIGTLRILPHTSSSIRVIDDRHAVEQLVPYLEDTLIWVALGPRPSNEVFDSDAGRIHGLSDYVALHLPHGFFLFVRSNLLRPRSSLWSWA